MLSLFVSLSLYALRASALNQGLPSFGPEKPGVGYTPEAWKISEEAGRDPNATSSVSFRRKYNNRDETWTWRVNVTEFPVPNRVDDLGEDSADFSDGLHVANTQWQLDWPGKTENLPAFLREEKINEIWFAALTTNQPSNNTERYSDDDGGDCKPMFGNKCVNSLINTASKDSIAFSKLEDTLSVKYDGGVGFAVASSLKDSDVKETLNRSDTLFYRTSEPYTTDNSTLFNRSLSAVQIFVMNVKYGGDERGESDGPTALCRIVDKSAQEDTEEGGDGNDASADGDDDSGGDEDGAMNWRQSSRGLWALIILSIMVVL